MKKIIIVVLTIISSHFVVAQTTMADGTVSFKSPSFFLDYLRDEKNADAVRPDIYAGVEGKPYWSDEWMYARIKLADNRNFDSVLMKMNLYENKIHFKDETGHEKMLAADIREIEITDQSSAWNKTIFVAGYGENKTDIYQVLADGKKISLLKKLKVEIKQSKVFNAPDKKSFELQERLFIYSGGNLYEENKNCSQMLADLSRDSKTAAYIKANDIKCNKEKDLLKLVDFCNKQ